jgi:large conductance mechanosensitive channel
MPRRRSESRAKGILIEFRGFILRGNVVDLAVAIAVGGAFTAVVAALTASFITPLIGILVGKGSFDSLQFTINGSVFAYGKFINALITFFITAAVLFFVVVKPLGHLLIRLGMAPAVPMGKAPCPACLTEIPVGATRCAFCTTELGVGWSEPEPQAESA